MALKACFHILKDFPAGQDNLLLGLIKGGRIVSRTPRNAQEMLNFSGTPHENPGMS